MKKLIVLGLALTPYAAFAAADDLRGLIVELISLINLVIPLLFGIALLGFMVGVIKYIASGSAEKIKEARLYIVYSVVAIAVMLSIWSLALFLKNSFFPRGPMPYDPTGGTRPEGVDFYPDGTGPTPPEEIMNPIENV